MKHKSRHSPIKSARLQIARFFDAVPKNKHPHLSTHLVVIGNEHAIDTNRKCNYLTWEGWGCVFGWLHHPNTHPR